MSYVNKNANLLLLFLVTLGFVLLVGTTVFYANNLTALNDKYESKVDSLKNVEKELNTKLVVIEQIRQDLKLKSEREQTFTEKYTEIRDVKSTLEEEKATLTKEKTSLEDQVAQAVSDAKSAQNMLAFEEARNADLENDLDEARSDLSSEKRINSGLRDQVNTLQAEVDACVP